MICIECRISPTRIHIMQKSSNPCYISRWGQQCVPVFLPAALIRAGSGCSLGRKQGIVQGTCSCDAPCVDQVHTIYRDFVLVHRPIYAASNVRHHRWMRSWRTMHPAPITTAMSRHKSWVPPRTRSLRKLPRCSLPLPSTSSSPRTS